MNKEQEKKLNAAIKKMLGLSHADIFMVIYAEKMWEYLNYKPVCSNILRKKKQEDE